MESVLRKAGVHCNGIIYEINYSMMEEMEVLNQKLFVASTAEYQKMQEVPEQKIVNL